MPDMDIEVALLVRDATYLKVPDKFQDLAGPDVLWKMRPKTTVQAKPSTIINAVIAKAARELSVQVKPSVYFPRGTKVSELTMHEYVFHGDLPDLQVAPLILVNPDGSAKWYFDPDEVTFAEIQAAREADVFLGDPQRLYLLVDEPLLPVGNGLDYWAQVFDALSEVHAYLKALGNEVGPYATLATVVYGFSRFVKAQHRRLGGDLKKYEQLFKLPRTDEQVARHMKVPEDSVPSIMHFFGFEKDKDGYWRPVNRPETEELKELAVVVDTAGHWYMSESVRAKAFAEILSHPVGERAKYAEPIIRRLNFEENQN